MKRILIVDDEPMMLKLADRALNKEYETILSGSAKEAVRLVEQEKPDLILSDLKMPGMSGYELQKLIHKEVDDRLPFIFMTADDSDDSENRGFEQGAADYIRKPIKAQLLLKRVARILDAEDENARLREAARIDGMTGLYNKAASEAMIGGVCRKTAGMLLIIDLDNFKRVNDQFGHSMGDLILTGFSKILRESFRGSDIVGRIGGDEFIVFCKGLNLPGVVERKAAHLNEEIRKVAAEAMGEELDFSLGCSVGGCVSGENGSLYDTLFSRADAAMYKVKEEGKHGSRIDTALLDESHAEFSGVRTSYRGRDSEASASAEEPDMERLDEERKKLPGWLQEEPALDIGVGLANAETAEVYLSSIGIFSALTVKNAALLKRCYEAGDLKGYTDKVHALKSTTRMIGAMYLSEMAAALERAANAENRAFLAAKNDGFLAELQDIVNTLQAGELDTQR